MQKRSLSLAALPLAWLALLAAAATTPVPRAAPPARSPNEIVAAAPAGDWVDIAPSDLLIMDLAPARGSEAGANGAARRVVIQLMPPPFSQGWIGNIRKLAAAHWWDGTSVNRVQDNYVAQWGDASEKKPLPAGLVRVPESEYVRHNDSAASNWNNPVTRSLGTENNVGRWSAFWHGWPFGHGGTPDSTVSWPVHCYAMVGVGRDMPPDTGTGAELYTVIGTPPRHLDRNIALVGRVIAGIEHLSSLPRGTGALGFYEKPEQRVPIVSVRLASELPAAVQPHYQYLSTESASFAAYADARANRRDAFFIQPAGGAGICNVPVPIRTRPQLEPPSSRGAGRSARR